MSELIWKGRQALSLPFLVVSAPLHPGCSNREGLITPGKLWGCDNCLPHLPFVQSSCRSVSFCRNIPPTWSLYKGSKHQQKSCSLWILGGCTVLTHPSSERSFSRKCWVILLNRQFRNHFLMLTTRKFSEEDVKSLLSTSNAGINIFWYSIS